jgi:carbamoyltransferase
MSLNIYERTPFKNIFVLPPMGDEGAALGSAIYQAFKLNLDLNWLKKYVMPYLGAEIDYNQNIEQEIKKFKNIEYTFIGKEWYKEAADSIANNKIIAVANGKMEFGPRALGNRSILANVMHKDTQDRINLTVKRRPKYQPFCPTILEEERERLFEKSYKHKHMATAFRMKREFWDILPSAIHIDGTARPQFVEKDDNEDIYNLLKELKRLTGYGIMINTSFNLHGRTIVRTISDAITDFIDCNIDELFIEGYKIVRK